MGSSSRKFRRRTETAPETQYRLASETRCRQIAEKIKPMMLPGHGFVLVTADIGPAESSFANTSYISTLERDDSARLLTEMLDHWRSDGKAHVGEPSVQMCTMLREQVHALSEVSVGDLARGMEESFAQVQAAAAEWEATLSTRDSDITPGEIPAVAYAVRLAVEALAIFDRWANTHPKADEG